MKAVAINPFIAPLNCCISIATIIDHLFQRLIIWPMGLFFRYAKLRVTYALEMSGTFSAPPRVSDLDMHHGTCVTYVPWYMPGSLTSGVRWSRWRGKKVHGILSACTTRNFPYLGRGQLWSWCYDWLKNPTTTSTTAFDAVCIFSG